MKIKENFMLIRITESEFTLIIRTIINLISILLILDDLICLQLLIIKDLPKEHSNELENIEYKKVE
jgi:hypothetical protein